MGQIEIYAVLKEKRDAGDDDFYTIPQIKALLKEKGLSCGTATSLQAAQLEAFGDLEATMLWERRRQGPRNFRAFRIKK